MSADDLVEYKFDRKYILEELRRLDAKQERMGEEISEIRTHMIGQGRFEKLDERLRIAEGALVGLMVRASVWGGLSGLIPIVLLLAFRSLSPSNGNGH